MLANEQVKFTDDWNPIRKRKILWGIIGFVSLLSIIDLYNDNQYSDKLKDKADSIFKKTETILGSVDTAVDSISEAQRKLIKLDSLVGATNIRLDSAITKSRELLKLEYTKLEISAPVVKILSSDVKIVKDSILGGYNIYFEMRNFGGRLAEDIRFKTILIAVNENGSQSNIYLPKDGISWKYPASLPATFEFKNKATVKYRFNKEEILEYGMLILVVRIKYNDKSLKNNLDFNINYIARFLNDGDEHFLKTNPKEEKFINKTLYKYNLQEMLSDNK
tara:strand:- start:36649 stop:37479 length:831 start_codon:yes stop_codon:yes gene_type:complete